MKKLTVLSSLVVLCACAVATAAGNGLTRLDAEPKNCEYLYTIDSSATTYKLSGAYEYLEQSILEQQKIGDSYYIVNHLVKQNSYQTLWSSNYLIK